MDIDELIDAWRVGNAVTLELLGMVDDEDFDLKPGKGKTIRSNFVHLVQVRRMWLEEKMAKELAALPKLDWKTATRSQIEEGLAATSELMERLFRQHAERKRAGGWTTLKFFAYLHE